MCFPDAHAARAGAVELRNEIGRRVGCDLPGTLVFDYPTAAAIAAYLADRLAPPAPDGSKAGDGSADFSSASVPNSSLVPAAAQQGQQQQLVLITGIRSRLAGLPGAPGEWADPIRAVPHDRWDSEFGRTLAGFGQAGPGRSAGSSSTAGVLGGRFGGFVLEWAGFDPELFAIPPSGVLAGAASAGGGSCWSLECTESRLDTVTGACPPVPPLCCCRGDAAGPSAASVA